MIKLFSTFVYRIICQIFYEKQQIIFIITPFIIVRQRDKCIQLKAIGYEIDVQ